MSRVKTLSVSERLELIGAVWETLSEADLPVSDEDKALLDARLAEAAAHPEDESPWAEVQARLRKQLRGSAPVPVPGLVSDRRTGRGGLGLHPRQG